MPRPEHVSESLTRDTSGARSVTVTTAAGSGGAEAFTVIPPTVRIAPT
jgi:hypothetical protein